MFHFLIFIRSLWLNIAKPSKSFNFGRGTGFFPVIDYRNPNLASDPSVNLTTTNENFPLRRQCVVYDTSPLLLSRGYYRGQTRALCHIRTKIRLWNKIQASTLTRTRTKIPEKCIILPAEDILPTTMCRI